MTNIFWPRLMFLKNSDGLIKSDIKGMIKLMDFVLILLMFNDNVCVWKDQENMNMFLN